MDVMKQKTAMQIMLDELLSHGYKIPFHLVVKCKELLEVEKQQTKDAIKNELKLIGNYFDVSKLETKEQGHHIRFTAILKDRFDYYNKTHGGNK
jgi:hypothetical protein